MTRTPMQQLRLYIIYMHTNDYIRCSFFPLSFMFVRFNYDNKTNKFQLHKNIITFIRYIRISVTEIFVSEKLCGFL